MSCKDTDDIPSLPHGRPDCIPMTDTTFSVVTAIFTFGGLLGSSVANLVMDRWGRRGAIRTSALSVAVGAGLMGMSGSLGPLLLGRYLGFFACVS
jgi:MFS transporter, SP family, solute carrier family 2 (facilitated glucose transporter), member 3